MGCDAGGSAFGGRWKSADFLGFGDPNFEFRPEIPIFATPIPISDFGLDG